MGDVIDFLKAKLLRKQQAEHKAAEDKALEAAMAQLTRWADELRQEIANAKADESDRSDPT